MIKIYFTGTEKNNGTGAVTGTEPNKGSTGNGINVHVLWCTANVLIFEIVSFCQVNIFAGSRKNYQRHLELKINFTSTFFRNFLSTAKIAKNKNVYSSYSTCVW